MKYVKQFLIILLISFLGEGIKYLLTLLSNQINVSIPIPASIIGLVLMLIGLGTKIIPLDSVKDAGSFLVEAMPVMFIPAGVGLIEVWLDLKPVVWQFAIITVVTTAIVMAVSSLVTQFIIRKNKKIAQSED